jgi:transcriptional regulator with XRE-family HTH domain
MSNSIASASQDDPPEIRVRKARAALGWTRGRMAEELGISERTLAEYETGHAPVRRMALLAIEALVCRAATTGETKTP